MTHRKTFCIAALFIALTLMGAPSASAEEPGRGPILGAPTMTTVVDTGDTSPVDDPERGPAGDPDGLVATPPTHEGTPGIFSWVSQFVESLLRVMI